MKSTAMTAQKIYIYNETGDTLKVIIKEYGQYGENTSKKKIIQDFFNI